jgi:hypothetical protein
LPASIWWGSGKRAAADGITWDVYEQNLLSAYHIRYGGWGGVGYYHVSDTYIALFSSFIACGVWEAMVAWQHINLHGRYECRKSLEAIDINAIVQKLSQLPIAQDLDSEALKYT